MYSKALSLQEDCTVAHYNLGIHLKKEGQLEQALESLQRVVELTPEDPVVRCQVGSLLLDVQAPHSQLGLGLGSGSRPISLPARPPVAR